MKNLYIVIAVIAVIILLLWYWKKDKTKVEDKTAAKKQGMAVLKQRMDEKIAADVLNRTSSNTASFQPVQAQPVILIQTTPPVAPVTTQTGARSAVNMTGANTYLNRIVRTY